MRFPGTIFRPDGRAIDRRIHDLTVAKLVDCDHRWLMRHHRDAKLMQVWLLDDDATVEAVPWDLWHVTMGQVWNGAAVLLIADKPEPVVSLREMALAVMAINETEVRRATAAMGVGA